MALRGLSETNVNKIKRAFMLGHEIFKSIGGWPTCTIYKPIRRDTARDSEGSLVGIEFFALHREVEYDMDQVTVTAVSGIERPASDITLTFYELVVPDGEYHIAFGSWISTVASTDGKGRWGPKCPKCLGRGKLVTGVNSSIIGTTWNNPHGDAYQCGYCKGVGFDIHNNAVKFYSILRRREDPRIDEAEYDCYSLENELALLTSAGLVREEDDVTSGASWSTTGDADWLDPDVQGDNYEESPVINDPDDMSTWDSDTWLDWWIEDPENRHMPSWITGNPLDGAGGYGPPADSGN